MLSEKLISKIKLNKLPAYVIAYRAGMHPSTMSQLINGIATVHPNDKRIIRIGKILGLKPKECFTQP